MLDKSASMNRLTRADLEVLLGAAVFPLKSLLEAEAVRVGHSLAHLPKFPPPAKPTSKELQPMIKESGAVLYASAAALANAFLEAIHDRGFYSLNNIPPEDQDWFEDRAVAHLEDLVRTIERDGLPEVLQAHYALERLQALEFRHLGKPVESRLRHLAPVRDNFRAGLRTEGKLRRTRPLPHILDAFELKPNLFGFGLNLNLVVEKLWARLKRVR
jgi:hypothetical protein